MKWRDLRMVSCHLRTVAKEIFKGLRFLDWGFYTESGNWFIVSCCWHAAEADASSGPQSWESLTNGFLAEETGKTSGLALSLGSMQRGNIPGFCPSAPWCGKFTSPKLGTASAAMQVPAATSACASALNQSVWATALSIPPWQQVLHGWRVPGE